MTASQLKGESGSGKRMTFSVVIVSLNGRERIAMPLEALRRCDPAPHEVIVVDNGSDDGMGRFVRSRYPEVMLVRSPRNLGFAGGNNLGILNAEGEAVVLLNDDTEPAPGWLAPLEKAFQEDKEAGLLGCLLLYPGSLKIQHQGGIVHPNGLTDHVNWGEETEAEAGSSAPPIACDYVTGAAMAIRREVIAEVGLLDAGFWPIYYEELDFCERARKAGWRVAVVPQSRVIHHESQTTGRLSPRFLRTYHRNRIRYLLKNRHGGQWWRVLRAEGRWLGRHAPWDNLLPTALAWGWAPFVAADVVRLRHSGRSSW